jgi:hypothetical protein
MAAAPVRFLSFLREDDQADRTRTLTCVADGSTCASHSMTAFKRPERTAFLKIAWSRSP